VRHPEIQRLSFGWYGRVCHPPIGSISMGRRMRARRTAKRSRCFMGRVWMRCVQTRTLACGESAAPGNSTAFVWVAWKGGPPATRKLKDFRFYGVEGCATRPSDALIMPCAPFAWESPRLELIFSTRVPVRNAAEDCSGWERIADVIKPPGHSFGWCGRVRDPPYHRRTSTAFRKQTYSCQMVDLGSTKIR